MDDVKFENLSKIESEAVQAIRTLCELIEIHHDTYELKLDKDLRIYIGTAHYLLLKEESFSKGKHELELLAKKILYICKKLKIKEQYEKDKL